MQTITLHIPAGKYGAIATAAALRGVDISQWVKRRIIKAAISTPADSQDNTNPQPAAGDTKKGGEA